jgi:uncharacterized metal-binding protein
MARLLLHSPATCSGCGERIAAEELVYDVIARKRSQLCMACVLGVHKLSRALIDAAHEAGAI